MSPEHTDVLRQLGPQLIGRTINLQDVSDDGLEILGEITDVEFNEDTGHLTIETKDTRRRWWRTEAFEPALSDEFSGFINDIELEIMEDGTIFLSPWDYYDYVYIKPLN